MMNENTTDSHAHVCVLSCLFDSFSISGCPSVLSYECMCRSEAFYTAVRACAAVECSESDKLRKSTQSSKHNIGILMSIVARYALDNLCLEYGIVLPQD